MSLEQSIREIIESDVYRTAFWGLCVADTATGEMLYELNPGKLFVPASTTKLWSCAAVLDAYGADHRFVTPVYRRGAVDASGVLAGDLILRASGDPNFSGRLEGPDHLAFRNHDHTYADWMAPELTDTDPLDGIEDLACQVAEQGIRKVTDVIVDDRLFERAPIFEGDPLRHSAIMVNDNVIDLIVTSGGGPGAPASLKTRPTTGYAQFDNRVITVARGEGTALTIEPVSERVFVISGQIEAGHAPAIQAAYMTEPQDFARALLIERLAAHGVYVAGSPLRLNPSAALPAESEYERLPQVARHVSPPLRELLKVVLKVSHNIQAGMLPLLLAAAHGQHSAAEGLRLEQAFFERIGIDPRGVVFGSGHGGSASDHTTPIDAIRLLRAMATRPDFAAYRSALPILGVDGTLYDAVPADSPARGMAQAKTGTLAAENLLNGGLLLGSKALAGYMTAQSGRELVFAVYVNRVAMPDPASLMAQGSVIGKLCELFYRQW